MSTVLSHFLTYLVAAIVLTESLAGSPAKPECIPPLETVSHGSSKAAAHLHNDLATYIAGMNKSSLQKAVFAMLARQGVVADLGAGSGITSYDLAVLMPHSKVIGVDLDPKMTEHAGQTYQRDNLEYQVGNAQRPGFPDGFLDAVFMSSTAHHLTSYGAGEFDIRHVHEAFDQAVRILKPNGIYVVRDFVIPDGPEWVHLELPATDGRRTGSVPELSTSALFEKFARDFRSSQHPKSGVLYEVLAPAKPGWNKYRVRLRDAAEFVLRKDYRDSYDAEIKEEYTFLSQKGFEDEFEKRGLRILHSGPIFNPWIVANRYEGKFEISEENGESFPFPPTNFVIVGQKVPTTEGTIIREATSRIVKKPDFVSVHTLRNTETGQLVDIVGRPNETIDVLPFWEQKDGTVFVLAKQGFPRPIAQSMGMTPNLSGVKSGGYRVEPISFLHASKGPVFSALEEGLLKRAGIGPERILSGGRTKPVSFYSSPGNIDERINSRSIEINPQGLKPAPTENYSGFSTSGDVRPFEAQKVLHAAQAGSILDARLELGVYHLLVDKQKPVGPWIGDTIELKDQSAGTAVATRRAATLLDPKKRQRLFAPAPGERAGFLDVWKARYEEVNREGKVVASGDREFVAPAKFSHNVVSSLPTFRDGTRILVGLEKRNLPAVQMHEGFSDLITNPAFRLPLEIDGTSQAAKFAVASLKEHHGVRPIRSWELGGPYQSSIGVTPETVYPRAVEVERPTVSGLEWVDLKDLVRNRHLMKDGHLSIAVFRLAHALGLL